MSYRCAMLGCGPRAEWHAMVYPNVSEINLTAVCDMDKERLKNFGAKYNIPNLYENYEEMLKKEKPDIVDAITQPDFRLSSVETAVKYGARAVIIEKPVAMLPSEAKALKEIVRKSKVKIAVSMQRRYNESTSKVKEIISSGKIGDILFVRCITKGNMMCMGPHLMDLLLKFLGEVSPVGVWAQVYGAEDLDPPHGIHPAAANLMANYTFPGNVEVFFECSKDSAGTKGEEDFWHHLELDMWGTKGRAWWTQRKGWGYHASGMSSPEINPTDWDTDEPIQQTKFTRAVAKWLDDDSAVHENCLENALKGFDALMYAIKSALLNRRLSLPIEVTDKDVKEMWRILKERERGVS